MNKLKPYLLVALSSLLISLARVPLNVGFLAFVAFVPLLMFFDLKQYNIKELIISGAIFSGIFVSIVLYWISSVTPGGLIGIFFVYILFYGLCFYAIQSIREKLGWWKYIGFVSVFVAVEYLQQFGETRFPWLNVSYSLADYRILLQALDLVGATGLSAIILIINVLIYRATVKRYRSLIAVFMIFLCWIAYGYWKDSSLNMEKHDAGIVVAQPAIPQDSKWDEDFYKEILNRYDKLAAQAHADSARLLILPEAAFPVYLLRDAYQISDVHILVNKYNLDIFAGFPDYKPALAGHPLPLLYYNAADLFVAGTRSQDPYYKNILVPVGERMLWLEQFPFLWKLQFGQANWEFGTEMKWYKSSGYEFAPSICYEIAFPELYHKSSIPQKDGKYHKTDYLVNITNDAWFGTSYGPWLHGIMTRFRAIENRIQIYRCAQTGISMIVDPTGKTLASTKLFEFKNIMAPLYINKDIPLIRKIYRYPMLISLLAIILFISSCLIPKKERTV